MQIRAFNGTLRDAQGLIEVDAETFGDCTYTAQTIVGRLSDPDQWTAVAVEGERVVGFVSCFRTRSLSADRWEVDELAVRPAHQGQGRCGALRLQPGCPAAPGPLHRPFPGIRGIGRRGGECSAP